MGADRGLGAGVGGAVRKVLAPTPLLLLASLRTGVPEGADPKVEIGPQGQALGECWGVQKERAVQEVPR